MTQLQIEAIRSLLRDARSIVIDLQGRAGISNFRGKFDLLLELLNDLEKRLKQQNTQYDLNEIKTIFGLAQIIYEIIRQIVGN